jgi:hypothetical protein
MLSFLVDIILTILLFKKKTPASIVVGITALVLIVLVVTVIRQADYVR